MVISLDIAASYEDTPKTAYESNHNCGFSSSIVKFDFYLEKKLECIQSRTRVKDHFHLFAITKQFPELEKQIQRATTGIPLDNRAAVKELFDELRTAWREEKNDILCVADLRVSPHAHEFEKYLDQMANLCLRKALMKETMRKNPSLA